MLYYIGEKKLVKDYEEADLNTCIEYLKNCKELGLDIETTRKYNKYGEIEGLDPYTSKIVMLQIGDKKAQFIIDTRCIDPTPLKEILENEDISLVGANLKFEYKMLKHHYNIEINNMYDVLLADQVINRGFLKKKKLRKGEISEFSLQAVAKKYLGITIDKSSQKEFLNIGSKPFTNKQIEYGADDISTPLDIKTHTDKELKRKVLEDYFSLESLYTPILGDMELNGMSFDTKAWVKLYKEKQENQVIIEDKLTTFILKNFENNPKFVDSQLSLFGNGKKSKVNFNSSKQVIEILKSFGACPKTKSKQTGEHSYTVNAKELEASFNTINKDKPQHIKDFIKLYLDYKEHSKLTTTYGKDFLKYVNPITGRIHTSYWQIQATGRISSSNPNLQNIPGEEEYRKCFNCPSNWKIINADYSGQETIVLANKSQEPNMIKLIKEGGDMHSFVASNLSGDPYEDYIKTKAKKDNKEPLNDYDKYLLENRGNAKAAGFAIQFGGDGNTIAGNLGVTVTVGKKVYEAYFKAFPKLKKYFEYVSNKSIRNGYILTDNVSKAKTFFRKPKSNTEKHDIYKKSLNYPVQGEAAVITKYANILLKRYLKEKGFYDTIAFITANVHDEIQLEVKDNFEEIAEILEKAMENAGKIWCKNPELKATAAITDYWTH